MDPENGDPAAPQDDDLAGALPAPAMQGDVPLPDPVLPSAGVPLDDGFPVPAAPAARRPVPVLRVGRPAKPARPARPARSGRGVPAVPPLPPPTDPGDAFPLPGRVDLGDGLRLTHRSMGLVVMIAMIPVVAVLGIVVVLSMGRGGSTPSDRGQQVSSADQPDGGAAPSSDGASDGASDGSSDAPAPAPAGVRKASLDDAGDALRDADVGRVGKVEAAWSYRDGDTEIVLAVTRRVTRRNGNFSARAASLRVFAIADPQGKPTVLAQTEDAGPTCPSGTEVRTTVPAGAVAVRDVDGDGTAEVFVATVHACGGDVRKRVTVFSGSAVYTLSGSGSLVAEPDPPYTDWPNGLLDAASVALDKA